MKITVDTLAQEIRRVDGNHSLGAGALAEALMPFLAALAAQTQQGVEVKKLEWRDGFAHTAFGLYYYIDPTEDGFILEKHEGASTSKSLYPYGKEAKAAAQSDYETRIRSALVDVPAVESEPVAYPIRVVNDAVVDRYGAPVAAQADRAHPPRSLSNEGEIVAAAVAVLNSWDERLAPEQERKARLAGTDHEYWSPAASMVSSEAIANLRAALSTRKGSAGDGSATTTKDADHG